MREIDGDDSGVVYMVSGPSDYSRAREPGDL